MGRGAHPLAAVGSMEFGTGRGRPISDPRAPRMEEIAQGHHRRELIEPRAEGSEI